MSSSALPRQADLRKLAAASATVEGCVCFRELSRLQSVLMQTEGSVNVTLKLSADDEGYRTVKGRIAARAVLQCQRCLGPVELDLDVPVMLAMVWAEKEIPSLPSRYDGIVVGADPVDVFDLVEEEVLLALPLVAAHEPGSCPSYSETPDIEASVPGKKNPFAVLREKGVESGD
jgi:uncharacterized protein